MSNYPGFYSSSNQHPYSQPPPSSQGQAYPPPNGQMPPYPPPQNHSMPYGQHPTPFPPMNTAPHGYPPYPHGPAAYPPPQNMTGYPQYGAQPPSTYPAPPPSTYPPPQNNTGYPPYGTQPPSTYPPATTGSYPPLQHQAPPGYPPANYPPHGNGYPPQQAYGAYPAPAPQSYPPGAPVYPPQQPPAGHYAVPPPPYPQGGPSAPGQPQSTGTHGTVTAIASSAPQGQRNQVPLTTAEIQKDVSTLRNALSGMGTDEKALIEVISKRNPQQMEQLSTAYQQTYGKTLWKAIDDDVSGDFQTLLEALVKPLADFESKRLYKAMAGAGTNETKLIETLVGKSNAEINVLKQRYQMIYGKSLESELRSELSGDLKRFFTSVLMANRDENSQNFDPNVDAETLYKAGPGKIGTDEKTYIHILTSRSYAYLYQLNQVYKSKFGKDIEHHIKKEFSGFIEDALVSTMRYATNPSGYIADLFHSSMAGIGTDESKLSTLVAKHFHHFYPPHPDLRKEILKAYAAKYGKGLLQAVESETSGDYKKLLRAILQKSSA